MRKIFYLIFILLFSTAGTANANIFNNFADLNSCISGYKNFSDYKSKLQSCYNKKGIDFDQETLNSLSNKTNVVKKSGFNLKKHTNSKNISKLKKYTFISAILIMKKYVIFVFRNYIKYKLNIINNGRKRRSLCN